MSESPSGIRAADDGTRYAGGTVRSDGSLRKQVKIRPGFVPKEDVAKYVPVARRTENPRRSPFAALNKQILDNDKTNRGVGTRGERGEKGSREPGQLESALGALSLGKSGDIDSKDNPSDSIGFEVEPTSKDSTDSHSSSTTAVSKASDVSTDDSTASKAGEPRSKELHPSSHQDQLPPDNSSHQQSEESSGTKTGQDITPVNERNLTDDVPEHSKDIPKDTRKDIQKDISTDSSAPPPGKYVPPWKRDKAER